ncbi:exodeoxyribonuclease VII small subunit [Nakamurella deserti]|uniref:exodeoxyribonuclease VII small subunit n=1 Tax=Nakamurella deserti TaxID=2164074 RepID=UPI000DBE4B77|nr:exodeoxyribonuclease VII small subunit [Nakamurella deserti]
MTAEKSGAPQDTTTAPTLSYEDARDELARVVQKLESGGLGLDDSLTLWERGEELARICERFLEGARERVDAALARADEQD